MQLTCRYSMDAVSILSKHQQQPSTLESPLGARLLLLKCFILRRDGVEAPASTRKPFPSHLKHTFRTSSCYSTLRSSCGMHAHDP